MVRSLNRKSVPTRSACGSCLMRNVIDNLVELSWRPVGDPESVPNDATPEMLTAGPTESVAGALRSLLGELATRLVHRSRAQRVDIADCNGLVEIGKTRSSTGVAGAAYTTRVDTGDVVEAVANAQAVTIVDAMGRPSRRSLLVRTGLGRSSSVWSC